MADTRPTLCLDTNFLFDLADNLPAAHRALGRLLSRRARLVVTNTVNEELGFKMAHGHPLAAIALRNMTSWGITPRPLAPTDLGITEITGEEMRRRGLIPDAERNDSMILAEAAFIQAAALITSDTGLLDTDHVEMTAFLLSKDLHPTAIISVRRIPAILR